MTVLPDTSVWIDYLRGTEPTATELDRLLAKEPPPICGPIVAELLAGVTPAKRDELWLAVASLPYVELGRDAWTLAGDLARELRSTGMTVPLVDLLVAIAAVRGGAALWTRDEDFERVRGVFPDLRLHR